MATLEQFVVVDGVSLIVLGAEMGPIMMRVMIHKIMDDNMSLEVVQTALNEARKSPAYLLYMIYIPGEYLENPGEYFHMVAQEGVRASFRLSNIVFACNFWFSVLLTIGGILNGQIIEIINGCVMMALIYRGYVFAKSYFPGK